MSAWEEKEAQQQPSAGAARATFDQLARMWGLLHVTAYGPKHKPQEVELTTFGITGAERKQKWVAVAGTELFERQSQS